MESDKIVIAGAGAIGLYIGGRLAAADRNVCFLARPRIVQALWRSGLTVTDADGKTSHIDPDDFEATADPDAAFAQAATVLVTVKSRDTRDIAEQIAIRAPGGLSVVSFQNGVRNPDRLRAALPGCDVRAGMVPFNVALESEPDLTARRATEGVLKIAGLEDEPLHRLLSVPNLPVQARPDMDEVQFSKLVINLNNAVNALAGVPLAEQMRDPRWRAISAACMAEAVSVAKAGGRSIGKVGAMNPRRMPLLLRLPNWLFLPLMRRQNRIDPRAGSSMQEDLRRYRETEIDDLQGEIVRMAEAAGVTAPVNAAIAALIHEAEALNIGPPMLGPDVVARRCGIRLP